MSTLAILTKCPLAKCPLAKCPLAKCRLAKCPLAKCHGFLNISQMRFEVSISEIIRLKCSGVSVLEIISQRFYSTS